MVQIILFGLAGFFKAIMDTIKDHYHVSLFGLIKNKKLIWWIYPPLSCENKYRWSKNSKVLRFLLCVPFVWVTDLWHFCGMLNILCYSYAAYLCGVHGSVLFIPILDFPAFIAARMSVFHVFYTWIFSLKFWKQYGL